MRPDDNYASIYDALLHTLGTAQAVKGFMCIIINRLQDKTISQIEKEYLSKIVLETILETPVKLKQ